MGHAVARRLDKAGWRLSPPEVEPPAAVTDCAAVRLQELADSGRLCLTVQVAESGAGGQRVGPFKTTKENQRWVHEGAVDFLEVSGDSGRFTATVRAFGARAAEAVGPGEHFYGCERKPGDAMIEALAWLVCRGLRPK
eukprot:14169213-Alexandrium_andersonii.AAC.1